MKLVRNAYKSSISFKLGINSITEEGVSGMAGELVGEEKKGWLTFGGD